MEIIFLYLIHLQNDAAIALFEIWIDFILHMYMNTSKSDFFPKQIYCFKFKYVEHGKCRIYMFIYTIFFQCKKCFRFSKLRIFCDKDKIQTILRILNDHISKSKKCENWEIDFSPVSVSAHCGSFMWKWPLLKDIIFFGHLWWYFGQFSKNYSIKSTITQQIKIGKSIFH